MVVSKGEPYISATTQQPKGCLKQRAILNTRFNESEMCFKTKQNNQKQRKAAHNINMSGFKEKKDAYFQKCNQVHMVYDRLTHYLHILTPSPPLVFSRGLHPVFHWIRSTAFEPSIENLSHTDRTFLRPRGRTWIFSDYAVVWLQLGKLTAELPYQGTLSNI